MTEEDKIRIDKAVSSLCEKFETPKIILDIYEVFKDFYGEEYVDLSPSLENIYNDIIDLDIDDYLSKFKSGDYYVYLRSYDIDYRLRILEDKEFIDFVFNTIKSYYRLKYRIIVHFPSVTITNENDKSVDIQDFYIRTNIANDGHLIGFRANRSTYSTLQFESDYQHSHTPGIKKSGIKSFNSWNECCTGSGPINRTMSQLSINGDNLDMWNMYCLELKRWTETESIAGVPYRRLEQIGAITNSEIITPLKLRVNYADIVSGYTDTTRELLCKYIKYLLSKNVLKYNYVNNQYSIGMLPVECIVAMSNAFIEYYNNEGYKEFNYSETELIDRCILFKGIIYKDNIIEPEDLDNNSVSTFNGKYLFTFKGKDVRLNISDYTNVSEIQLSLFLNLDIAEIILTKILQQVNFNYGHTINKENRYI